MTVLACFLEEQSAKAMLEGILPKILPDGYYAKYIVFDGKQDLENQLGGKLRNWNSPNTVFLIMRDQDSGNCIEIKKNLLKKCLESGKTNVLVRIACRELESYYLGDLEAVSSGLKIPKLSNFQNKRKYRNPDKLGNPSEELNKITGNKYQKIGGSRSISPYLKLDQTNCSGSFNVLIKGITRLTECNNPGYI